MDTLYIAVASSCADVTTDDALVKKKNRLKRYIYGHQEHNRYRMIKIKVMIKALKILKREHTNEEFAIYLQQITKRSGDSVEELREKTKNLSLEELAKMIKKYQP